MCIEVRLHRVLHVLRRIDFSPGEWLTCNLFVQGNVPAADGVYECVVHGRHCVPSPSHEAVFHEPFAHEFFAELFLRFACSLALLVAVRNEVAGTVRRVDLVDEVEYPVAQPKFVLRVDEQEPAFRSKRGAAGKQRTGHALQFCVERFRDDATRQDVLAADVLVVSGFRLRRRGDDGGFEPVVLPHPFGQGHAA